MELWDIYNAAREKTGQTHHRGEPLFHGQYHLIVFVWVFNGRGELLVTKRSPEKEVYPNYWENTGGSAIVGENSLQAIRRELWEETGIAAQETEFIPLGSFRAETSFSDIYALIKDVPLSALTLQPGETCDAQWVTLEQLLQMIEQGSFAAPDARRFRQLGDKILPFFNEK